MNLHSELDWRGLIHTSSDGLPELLTIGEKPVTYVGFDPTASSLHVGNLLPIVVLARIRELGHDVIALVGGGTGLIGDPSGKTSERTLQTSRVVTQNVKTIRVQLEEILRRAHEIALTNSYVNDGRPAGALDFEDNATWLRNLRAIKLMRDVGKHFTVNWMVAKDSIDRRFHSTSGISYTEFSYLLLQAYDFLQLFERRRCVLQVGGSDQWGNITAGTELIRRTRNAKAHGLVFPLLVTESGVKFGKTEAGAVWLDRKLTRAYDFYQFWLNTGDRDVVKYLKYFTFLNASRIAELEALSTREPEKRHAQRELARQVTALVHGHAAVQEAEANAAVSFATTVTPDELRKSTQKIRLSRRLFEDGIALTRVLMLTKLAPSASEGVRLIRSGAISINNEKINDTRFVLTIRFPAISEGIFRLSRGKTQRAVVEVVDGPVASVDKLPAEP